MKILNFGSLNIDYVYNVREFLKPGETIQCTKIKTYCGGKGLNQSIALARAGADVFHAGKIGYDGKILLEALKESGVNTRFVRESNSTGGHAIIQVDENGNNGIIVYGGANRMIENSDIDEALSEFSSDDMVLLQNEINSIDTIIKKAYTCGMKTALNPSPVTEDINGEILSMVNYLFINETEGMILSGCCENEGILSFFSEKYPSMAVILTLGSNGSIYSYKNEIYRYGIYETKVADTTGAGDTFTGFFLAGLSESIMPQEAMQRATAASAIAVSRLGASPSIPNLAEVLEFQSKSSLQF